MTNELTKRNAKADIGTTTEKAGQIADYLVILAQAFYGNRTMTEIRPENMDRFILGYLDSSLEICEPIDRTVVRIPGSDNLVLVYNKYQEDELTHFVAMGEVMKKYGVTTHEAGG